MANFVDDILLWKETVPNTIPTSPKCYALKVESFGITATQNSETNNELGNGRGASAKAFGALTIGGDLGMIFNTDNAPILFGLGIGDATATADATADAWAGSTVVTKDAMVNHSDGLHTLVCYIGGTTGLTEPDLAAYPLAKDGRNIKLPVDGTVTWILMPKLFAQSGNRGDCIHSFGTEVSDSDKCIGGASAYSRFNGLHISSLPFSVAGSDMSIKSSVSTMGMSEEDSILITDEGGTYEPMSAKAGFTEVEVQSNYFYLEDCTFYLNGVKASIKTTSMTATINNGVTIEDALNDEKIQNIGVVTIDGTFDILMDNATYANAASHTVQSAKLEFKKPNGCVMSLDFPQFKMERTSKVYSTDKSTMLSIPFSSFDTTDEFSIKWSTVSPISF